MTSTLSRDTASILLKRCLYLLPFCPASRASHEVPASWPGPLTTVHSSHSLVQRRHSRDAAVWFMNITTWAIYAFPRTGHWAGSGRRWWVRMCTERVRKQPSVGEESQARRDETHGGVVSLNHGAVLQCDQREGSYWCRTSESIPGNSEIIPRATWITGWSFKGKKKAAVDFVCWHKSFQVPELEWSEREAKSWEATSRKQRDTK